MHFPQVHAANDSPARGRAASHHVFAGAGAALACLIAGKAAIALAPFGPLARHMADHILLMNVLAPLCALMLAGLARVVPPGRLALAGVVQLAALWGWHAPNVLNAAMHSFALHMLMQTSLFAAALWFWLDVFADRSAFRWRALLALLLTGKLFCLLGVLLVFAPRGLYGAHAAHHVPDLSDQHLAGLLMVVACPLSYVLAGVVIAAQALRGVASGGGIVSRVSKT